MNIAKAGVRILAVAVVGVVGIIVATPHFLIVKDLRSPRRAVAVEVMTAAHARRSISCMQREASQLCGFWGGTLAGGYFIVGGGSGLEKHVCYFGWLIPSFNELTISSNGEVSCR
jgi:hypothetical protein